MKQFFSPQLRRLLRTVFSIIQIIIDIALFNSCLLIMHTPLSFHVHAFLTITMTAFFFFSRLYGFILWTFHDEMFAVIRSWVLIFFVSIISMYIGNINVPFLLFIASLALFIPVTLAARYVFRRVLFSLRLLSTSVIIVGSGMAAEMFAENISVSPFISRRVVGFLDDDESKQNKILSGVHVLGKLRDFQRIQSEVQADEAVIALPKASRQTLEDTLNMIEDNVKRVLYIPDVYMFKTYPELIRRFEYIPVISTSQGLLNPMNRFIKALMDYTGGFAALILFSPLMIYVALKIKFEDKGSIFFRHKRIGRDLKPFYVYKFRSMVPNAEEVLKEMLKDEKLRKEFEEAFKFKDDPRITKVGKFLRKTSLDELPQIFNVLRGEMSLVGSRPVVQKEVDLFYGYKTAKQIFHAKPGMTGLWQVSGRNDVEDYGQRIEYDLYYIANWSAWLDIVIMIRTVKTIFTGRGAY